MTTNTILVSGGAGYIGSHAAYALKKAGYEPVVLDNLSTGNAWATANHAFEEGDVGDSELVREICEKYQPTAAMHFAAFIEVGESVQNPAKYFENNRDKASEFFRTLHACGVKKVVFSSTAAVYGEVTGNEPISELTSAKPINPYGQSKYEAEAFLRMLDGGGMRSVALRYFNVAGAAPADSPDRRSAPTEIASYPAFDFATDRRATRNYGARWDCEAASPFMATITQRPTALQSATTFTSWILSTRISARWII